MKPNLQIEYRSIDALLPYARNPRTHSPAQIAKIAASIVEFGWTQPILVDGDNGIIAGHGRLAAARKLGLDQVPVIELAHLTVAQKRALVIADNRLALDAGWDEEMLALELAELSDAGYDLALTGFEDAEIEALLAGLATGVWASPADAVATVEIDATFTPQLDAEERDRCGDQQGARRCDHQHLGESDRLPAGHPEIRGAKAVSARRSRSQ